MSMADPGDEMQAVVLWVKEKKVSCVPLSLISGTDRFVSAVTKIKLPGHSGEYVGKIEHISDDKQVLEKCMTRIEAKMDAEENYASNMKRTSKPTKRYGMPASDQAVDVATGKRRGVPMHLAQNKKQATAAKKSVVSCRKEAERMLEDSQKPTTTKKPDQQAENRHFPPDNNVIVRRHSDDSTEDEENNDYDPSNVSMRIENSKFPDLPRYVSDGQVADRAKTFAKSPVRSESTNQLSPVKPTQPNSSKRDSDVNKDNDSSDGDFEEYKSKAFYRKCQRLKRQFSTSVKTFMEDLVACMDESGDEDANPEVDYVEVVSPRDCMNQYEISKGSGIFIAASAKHLILLAGQKGGPKKLLTSLVQELFQQRLKEIHGTAKIRPNVLRAIFSFVAKNVPKEGALNQSEMVRIINNLTSEARRPKVRSQQPKKIKVDTSKGKNTVKNFEDSLVHTPVKNVAAADVLLSKPSPKSTQNNWVETSLAGTSQHQQQYQHHPPVQLYQPPHHSYPAYHQSYQPPMYPPAFHSSQQLPANYEQNQAYQSAAQVQQCSQEQYDQEVHRRNILTTL